LHQGLDKFDSGHHLYEEEQALDSASGMMGGAGSMYRLGDEGLDSRPAGRDLGNLVNSKLDLSWK